ncbi:MAG: fibronectin type III domain-containing protein [Chitinophagales bacterium]
MKKILFSLLCLPCCMMAWAETPQLVATAPKGFLVFLGSGIPNGVKATAIKVEKNNGSGWQQMAEVKAPADEAQFLLAVKQYAPYFPDTKLPSEPALKRAWATARRTGSLDSVGFEGRVIAVRLALGAAYYDRNAKDNEKAQFRITIQANNNNETLTTNEVRYPFHPAFDNAVLSDYDYSQKGMYIRWRSVGKNAPADFKVYRFVDKKPVEVTGATAQYRIKDSTYYSIQDTAVAAGKQYQYALVGLDRFGNTAYGSAPVIVKATNFNSVYFKKTAAKRDNKQMAIAVQWALSDAQAIQSIQLFRSEKVFGDFKLCGSARATDTLFLDNRIDPDKMYYYYAIAADRTGKELVRSSTFFESAMDTRQPLRPFFVSAEGVKQGVQLKMACNDRFINGYRIFRANGGSDSFEVIRDFYPKTDSITSFIDSSKSLSGKQTYRYYFTAFNTSSKQSQPSATEEVRPAIPTEPAAPSFLRAYYQDNQLQLSWEDVMRADRTIMGYRLQYRTDAANAWKPLFERDSVFSGSHLELQQLEEGKTYEFMVKSADMFGSNSKTGALNAVEIPVRVIAPPAGLRAVNLKEGVQLEWDMATDTDVVSFAVYRYQRGQQPVSLGNTKVQQRAFLDKTARSGELYFYYIASVLANQRESTGSAEVGVRR